MPADLTASIIRIFDGAQNTVGTGFVLTPTLAVTCAHVVKAAGSSSGQPLDLRFYCGDVPATARVHSQGYAAVETDDVAFIELACLPPSVEPVTLARAEGRRSHPYHAFGFACLAEYAERHVTGATIGGLVNHPHKQPMLQLNGGLIKHGLSGGPVLDTLTGQVVGMISEFADDVGDNAHLATRLNWATTTDTLDVEIVLGSQFFERGMVYFDGVWSQTEQLGQQQLLRTMAQRNESWDWSALQQVTGITEDELRLYVRWAERHDIIRKLGTAPITWEFCVPLMRTWLNNRIEKKS